MESRILLKNYGLLIVNLLNNLYKIFFLNKQTINNDINK